MSQLSVHQVSTADPSANRIAAQPLPSAGLLGLGPEQAQTMRAAVQRMRPISRVAMVAAVSGWSLAVFATLSVPFAFFGFRAAFITLTLAIIAWIELRGWRRLRLLDPTATRVLGCNQIVLGIALVIYGCWGAFDAIAATSPYAEHIAAGGQMAEMLQPIDALNRTVAVAFGICIAAFGIIGPGLTSWYYFSRTGKVQQFLADTPSWVVETLRVVR